MTTRPDVIVIMTDQERAAPPYEPKELTEWRRKTLTGAGWFEDNGVSFRRHYTGSLACVPSRPTLFTGQFPDVHGVTQTNGLGKMHDDSRMRWLRPGEVPTLGHWFRSNGYDTHYQGKWHMSHADLVNPETGRSLATNDNAGVIDGQAVQAYLEANPLDPFGFSGWVGPEPHGASRADAGVVRDDIIAERVVAWLKDRYARRQAGDQDAKRPFLLVTCFINPHDIVLAPAWLRQPGRNPIEPGPLDPPSVPPSPTDNEDLSTKPAAQVAYRASYPSTYGPPIAVERTYKNKASQYRDLYYRLHAEVDAPIDMVRRAVTESGSQEAVLVRTSDHGELLGAHGGLHQKWFNLYDEATRVPFVVARIGSNPSTGRIVDDAPTSHVDLVPTLLAAAGIDQHETAESLRESFSEVHSLPGRNLMGVVDEEVEADRSRFIYAITRDNMPEGDSGASGLARRMGRVEWQPPPLRIQVPAHVGANFEAIVGRVDDSTAAGGSGHLWKIVRSFDDPDTWTEPGVRHLASTGIAGDTFRTEPLVDQWELYDLDLDPIEADNRWDDSSVAAVFSWLVDQLSAERDRSVPERNTEWPYATRTPTGRAQMKNPPAPARILRRLLQKVGMHPEDTETIGVDLGGRRALIVATNHGVLNNGKPTGVFASELTVPYYAFLGAGMEVDVASPLGGVVPVEPQSLKPVLRTESCDRYLADSELQQKLRQSLAVGDLDMDRYDIVFLSGGWGAAFDLGNSEELGEKITESNELGLVIGGVCHGPLGLLKAKATDGSPLLEGRKATAVTDKQIRELRVTDTPQHPETELRKAGARFESASRFRDPLANHWVVDGNLVTGQNQNAAPMVAREMMKLASQRLQSTSD